MVNKKNSGIDHPVEMLENSSIEDVQGLIVVLRGQRVLLDCDVAHLYGVSTKVVNQAVKNNPDKFPYGYLLGVDMYEKKELVKNFDRFNKLKHSVVLPTAFTEKGLYMLATILKSPQAVQTTLSIIETFAAVRELAHTIGELQQTGDKKQQQSLLKRTGELMDNVMGRSLSTQGTETELELNFAVLKVKHKIKRSKE